MVKRIPITHTARVWLFVVVAALLALPWVVTVMGW